MKRFYGAVFEEGRINGLARVSLLCIIWWITQAVASVLVVKICGIFTHSTPETWSAIERLSPVPHFLTSLSAVVMSSCKGLLETVAPLSVAVVQFAVLTIFTWLIVREVAKLFIPEKKLTFGKHLKMAVVLIPVLLSISLLARFVQIPLDGLNISSFLKYTLSHFVPDVVSIGLMAIFINSFFFGQSGFKSLKSIVLSIQSTSGKMFGSLAVVFAISFIACASTGLLLSTDSVLTGLYEPFRYAVSAACWASSGLIWIYCGLAYHEYVESERLEPLPASKGA